jgi:oligoribonuclease
MNADLVWIDLEMTGLDASKDRIIEMATIITDSDLNVIAEGPVLAIKQPQTLLDGMDDWNQTHHSASGLLDRIAEEGVSEREGEAVSLAFIEQHTAANEAPLCGNSIWQDRRFLSRYMPTLEAHLHYRMIDVSSVKELAKRWHPEVASGFKKKGEHTALADIRESIEELRFYREHLFRGSSE